VALFVLLDIKTTSFVGVFSDNGFHMVSKNKQVKFETKDFSVTEQDVASYLTVHSLMNTYDRQREDLMTKLTGFLNQVRRVGMDRLSMAKKYLKTLFN
jgi:hypothetical protein